MTLSVGITRHVWDTPIMSGTEIDSEVEPYKKLIKSGFDSGMIQEAIIKLSSGYTVTFTKVEDETSKNG